MRAAVYVRISKDPEGERAGVERQRQDSLRECERRGWEPVVFEDNDVSAYAGKPRPAYEQMLEAVRAGEVGAVVAWAPDRLTRHLRELETLIATVESAGCQVVTVQAGDWDLTTPEGRFMARQLGLLARLESEKMAARHARAKQQEAEAGRPHMGGQYRPWGFEEDRVSHRPEEAAQIRDAALRLLDGESLASVSRRVGLAPDTVGKALRNPRMVGKRQHKGVLYPAAWEPILDDETWTAVRTVLDSRKGRSVEPGGTRARRTLLAGFLRCGLCGGRCTGSRGDYVCDKCKRLRRLQEPVDRAVRDYVLERADLEVPAKEVPQHLRAAVQGYIARIAAAGKLWRDGVLSDSEYAEHKRELDAAKAEAQAKLDAAVLEAAASPDLRFYPRTPRGVNPRTDPEGFRIAKARMWWEDDADLRQKRALVAKYVERVVIDRAIRGEPDKGIEIVPKPVTKF